MTPSRSIGGHLEPHSDRVKSLRDPPEINCGPFWEFIARGLGALGHFEV